MTSKEILQQELPFVENIESLQINYNISPTQQSYVITNDHPEKMQCFNWGLIPYWSAGNKITGKLINARAEGIETRPSFRIPIRQRRCLVPADSFYEWKKEGTKNIPNRIFLKNGCLLIMAGIWDVCIKDNYELKTFSIITTAPNKEMQNLHNRMPVLLLSREIQEKWLMSENLSEILKLLQTPEDDILGMYRISTIVNKVSNNSPEIHIEVPEPPRLF